MGGCARFSAFLIYKALLLNNAMLRLHTGGHLRESVDREHSSPLKTLQETMGREMHLSPFQFRSSILLIKSTSGCEPAFASSLPVQGGALCLPYFADTPPAAVKKKKKNAAWK